MKVLGVSGEEQKALWLILGAIYHLGAAGATKGRKAQTRLRGNASAVHVGSTIPGGQPE